MTRLHSRRRQMGSEDIERTASRLSMAMWNRIAQLPQFAHLNPKDFPHFYEAVREELLHFWKKNGSHGGSHV